MTNMPNFIKLERRYNDWASNLNSLSFNFLIYKMGTTLLCWTDKWWATFNTQLN